MYYPPRENPGLGGWSLLAVIVAFITTVAIGAGVGIATLLGSCLEGQIDKQPSRVQQLATLRSGDTNEGSVSGSLFLIVGSMNGDRTFYYYEQEAGGWLSPQHLNGDEGVYVCEEARADAVLETYSWHFAKSWYWLVGMHEFGHTYRFHVPIGTVKRDITLQ